MDKIVDEAKLWSESSSVKIEVVSVDGEDRKITFRTPLTTFYVTAPGVLGEEDWSLWSSDDRCVSMLCVEMENLCKPSNSISDILKIVTHLLATAYDNTEEDASSETHQDEEEEEEEDEDDDDDYYYDDEDVEKEPSTATGSALDGATSTFTGEGTPAAVHRLLADLKSLTQSSCKYGIAGNPVEDNLFLWEVELSDFPPKSLLAQDLLSYASSSGKKPVIAMEMKFPKDYPMNPPFVRILRPRFKFLTGHVTIGGSICMQMLTRSGWSPSNDIEGILIQIRAEIMSDPKARLDLGLRQDYGESEAKAAFERMVMRYGWNK